MTVDWQGVASELAPQTLAEWEAVVARHTLPMENRMTDVDRLREAAQAVSDKARVVVDHLRPTKPRWVVEDAEFSALRAALEAAPVADEVCICTPDQFQLSGHGVNCPARPAPAEVGLDVARLEQALLLHAGEFIEQPESFDTRRAVAENLAAIYARLAALTPEPPEGQDPGRDASPERDDGYVRADVEAGR